MALTMLAAYAAGATALTGSLVGGQATARTCRRRSIRRSTGHARLARRVASLIPFYEYDEQRFFRSDDPPDDVAAQRSDGFQRLAAIYRERFAQTSALTAAVQSGASDLQFIAAYRVPFQYQPHRPSAFRRRLVR